MTPIVALGDTTLYRQELVEKTKDEPSQTLEPPDHFPLPTQSLRALDDFRSVSVLCAFGK